MECNQCCSWSWSPNSNICADVKRRMAQLRAIAKRWTCGSSGSIRTSLDLQSAASQQLQTCISTPRRSRTTWRRIAFTHIALARSSHRINNFPAFPNLQPSPPPSRLQFLEFSQRPLRHAATTSKLRQWTTATPAKLHTRVPNARLTSPVHGSASAHGRITSNVRSPGERSLAQLS